jgi:hypothetical protein
VDERIQRLIGAKQCLQIVPWNSRQQWADNTRLGIPISKIKITRILTERTHVGIELWD